MQPTQSESAQRKSSPEAGFSLIEVLAALVVTTLLVLALTPLVGQMLATWSRGSEASRAVELESRASESFVVICAKHFPGPALEKWKT